MFFLFNMHITLPSVNDKKEVIEDVWIGLFFGPYGLREKLIRSLFQVFSCCL